MFFLKVLGDHRTVVDIVVVVVVVSVCDYEAVWRTPLFLFLSMELFPNNSGPSLHLKGCACCRLEGAQCISSTGIHSSKTLPFPCGCFRKLGVHLSGLFIVGAPLFGVSIRGRDFWKLPNESHLSWLGRAAEDIEAVEEQGEIL